MEIPRASLTSRLAPPLCFIGPSFSQTPVEIRPVSILLVEEYKALAIAFGSALKKIAPAFETRIVGSLDQAEPLLVELKPALLVIDCDPPPLHSVRFFDRLRWILPQARVLIVAAENAGEFADRETLRPVLEFIKKPFDLLKFGAVVERLLAPDAPELSTVGHLQLLDLILLYAITAAPRILRVEASDGRSGEIHFSDGRIVHAAVMGRSGVEALKVILRWRAQGFSEAERALDSPRTIHGAWVPILRAAMKDVELEEVEPEKQPLVRLAKTNPAPALPATKMLVVDDTDLLLVFVEEVLVTAHPELEIIKALSGFDGLKFAVAEKPDLLLLDYDLPDISGGDVCEKMLENEETARIPVIMMSGHVAEMMAAAESFENVVATIAKPFLSAALIEVVERTLRDLPKFRTPFAKRKKVLPAPVEKLAPILEDSVPTREGDGNAALSSPPPVKPSALLVFVAGLGEERMPASMLDSSPRADQEIEDAAETSKTQIKTAEREEEEEKPARVFPVAPTGKVAAGIRNARSNAVVLGFPLEVLGLELSTRLRLKAIRARPLGSTIWIRTLSQSLPALGRRATPFRLAHVQFDGEGQFDILRVAPAAKQEDLSPTRYRSIINEVALLPLEDSATIQLTTAAAAPLHLELLALFELSGVELSLNFGVQHLLLKLRDKRMRATLHPETMHLGATFTATESSLDSSGMLSEIRLVAL